MKRWQNLKTNSKLANKKVVNTSSRPLVGPSSTVTVQKAARRSHERGKSKEKSAQHSHIGHRTSDRKRKVIPSSPVTRTQQKTPMYSTSTSNNRDSRRKTKVRPEANSLNGRAAPSPRHVSYSQSKADRTLENLDSADNKTLLKSRLSLKQLNPLGAVTKDNGANGVWNEDAEVGTTKSIMLSPSSQRDLRLSKLFKEALFENANGKESPHGYYLSSFPHKNEYGLGIYGRPFQEVLEAVPKSLKTATGMFALRS